MSTITKKNLIQEIHQEEKIESNAVRRVVESLLNKIINHINDGNRIEIRNFGVFAAVLNKQKIGRNPKDSKKDIVIPARYRMKFKAAQKVKRMLCDKEAV